MDTRDHPDTRGSRPRRGLAARLRPFRTPVRGHAYASRPPGAAEPRPGLAADLVREPANPADPYAVAVWLHDGGERWRMGYLDRGVAVRLAPRIDAGQRMSARLEAWTQEPQGRWRRPLVVVLPEADDTEDPGSQVGPRAEPRGAALASRPPGVRRRRLPESRS